MPKPGKPPRFAGWPRRKLPATFQLDDHEYRTELLPNLWIGGANQQRGDWLNFAPGRERRAFRENLCVVCGEKMEGVRVFGRYGGGISAHRADGRVIDGPPGHPRCIRLAVATCPHFRKYVSSDNDVVAFLYSGHKTGLKNRPVVGPNWATDEPISSLEEVDDSCVALSLLELAKLAKERPLG